MTSGPKKPFDDPLVKAALLAAGAAWTVGMLSTFTNSGKRRRFFDSVAKSMAENAGKQAERRESARQRAEEQARQREAEKAEKKRQHHAKFFPPFTRPVGKPYPDAPIVRVTTGWGGAIGFYNSSDLANSSISTFWSHWDGRGKFSATIAGERVAGEFFDRGGYNLGPGGEFVGTAKDYFTQEQVDIILRLLGGEGGPKEITFHDVKREGTR